MIPQYSKSIVLAIVTLLLVGGSVILSKSSQCKLIKINTSIYLISNPSKERCTITTDPYTVVTEKILTPFISSIQSDWDLSLFPEGIDYYLVKNGEVSQQLHILAKKENSNSKEDNINLIHVKEKFDSNYPYADIFPYYSKTMIAGYGSEIRVIVINTKLTKDVVDRELDSYLQTKGVSLDMLKSMGITTKIDNTATIF